MSVMHLRLVPPELDRPTILRLAAAADSDPRTVAREIRALRGAEPHVRGRAGERIRAVLTRFGIAPQKSA
jgi:hypothetical protein